jgi:hypothetical protein
MTMKQTFTIYYRDGRGIVTDLTIGQLESLMARIVERGYSSVVARIERNQEVA